MNRATSNLIGKTVLACFIYAVMVFTMSVCFFGKVDLTRDYMENINVYKIHIGDFTIAQKDKYCSDLYIFRGNEKIAVDEYFGIMTYTNWAFPFKDYFYIYKNLNKISDMELERKDRSLKIMYENMLN